MGDTRRKRDDTPDSARFLSSWGLALILVLGFLGMRPGAARAVDGDGESEAREAAHRMTLQLLEIPRNQVTGASSQERETTLNQLRAIASARRQILLGLMETLPGAVLEVALPRSLSKSLPEDLRAHLERRMTVEGRLEAFFADGFDPTQSSVSYFLKTDRGERLQLHFARQGAQLAGGSKVRVHGVRLADHVALETMGGDSVEVLGTALVASAKLYKVLVLCSTSMTTLWNLTRPMTPRRRPSPVQTGSTPITRKPRSERSG